MVLTCFYCGCKPTTDGGKKFFSVPIKDPERLQKWAEKMGFNPCAFTQYSKICSDHFESKSFVVKDSRTFLTNDAVPTLYKYCKSTCVYCGIKREHTNHQTFHRFPLKKENLLNLWLKSMNLENFKPSTTSLLCSDHFERKCYRTLGRLKPNSVPTIFSDPKKRTENEAKHQFKFVRILNFTSQDEPKAELAGLNSSENVEQQIENSDHLFENDTVGASSSVSSEVMKLEPNRLDEVQEFEDLDWMENDSKDSDSISDSQSMCDTTWDLDVLTTPEKGARRVYIDHNYVNSPGTTKKKLEYYRSQLEVCRVENRVLKRKMAGMAKTIVSLRENVNTWQKEVLVLQNVM